MVGVVQLAEHRIVVPGVVGSSPITHPTESRGAGSVPVIPAFFFPTRPHNAGKRSILGRSQVVRQGTLTPSSAGSSPAVPASFILFDSVAQSAEQLPFKQWVRGSNPRRVTRKFREIAENSGFTELFFHVLSDADAQIGRFLECVQVKCKSKRTGQEPSRTFCASRRQAMIRNIVFAESLVRGRP